MSRRKEEAMLVATELPPAVKKANKPFVAAEREPTTSPPELPTSITIEVPLGKLDEGYLSRHVDARLTSQLQCESLRRLVKGLRQAGEKLEDGKQVTSYADAVKWLLEQVGQRRVDDGCSN
jgi:hypothetical protein